MRQEIFVLSDPVNRVLLDGQLYLLSFINLSSLMIDQTGLNIYDYWYDVKECTSCGVYWVNLEIKDCNSIETLLYTYLCIALCISADGCILWQA